MIQVYGDFFFSCGVIIKMSFKFAFVMCCLVMCLHSSKCPCICVDIFI